MPNVASSKATSKATVVERMVYVESLIVASLIVAHPLAIVVYMGRLRVTRVLIGWGLTGSIASVRSWSVGGNEAAADPISATAAAVFLTVLSDHK